MMFGNFMLAAALLARYGRTGAVGDLDMLRRILEQTAATMLGIVSVARYEHTHALVDVTSATRMLERALAATPRHDATRVWLLAYLGFAFWSKHAHTESLDDLDRAIAYSRHAAAAATSDHPAHGVVARFHTAIGPADWMAA